MSGILLWVRATLRRHWAATIGLAVLVAVAAGLVGASAQAARRAAGTVDRHAAQSRSFDTFVGGCPPGVDVEQTSVEDLYRLCISLEGADRLRQEVLGGLAAVEATGTAGALVAGVLDPDADNGWGQLTLVYATGATDDPELLRTEILVDGRYPDEHATDEVMIGEAAAQASGIRVGDTIQLTSWPQDVLDAAVDGRLPPSTPTVPSRVVGVIRTVMDLQSGDEVSLNDSILPEGIHAPPGWVQAHGADFAGYGFGAIVRLHDGPDAVDELLAQIDASGDWTIWADSIGEVDMPALRHVVDAEREALVIFAVIAALAGCVLVGLTLARQLRREFAQAQTLGALGFGRSTLVAAGVLRGLVIAFVATLVAITFVVLLSPLGPLGSAGRLEYSHPFRIDWVVLGLVAAGIVILVSAVSAGSVAFGSARAPRRIPRPAKGPRRGAVSTAALALVRGTSLRIAAAAGCIAVTTAVAASMLVLNVDAVIDDPPRFGAWWDVAVGQYSEADALADGEARLRANPAVAAAASVIEETSMASLDGTTVPLIALVPVVGEPEMLMASGRAPIDDDEIAVGAATARELGKSIGDTVRVTSNNVDGVDVDATVTGIAVMNNPVRPRSNAGQGVVMRPTLARQVIGETVAQSIVIDLSPSVDHDEAVQSIIADFPSSSRAVTPQADLADLTRLRAVPWLISAVIAALALAAIVHAMVTMFNRRVGMLAVLAALGLTAGQRRCVGLLGGVTAVGAGLLVGVPAGVVLGRWIWDVMARRISIPALVQYSWTSAASVLLGALLLTGVVVWLASWRANRVAPAAGLRVE